MISIDIIFFDAILVSMITKLLINYLFIIITLSACSIGHPKGSIIKETNSPITDRYTLGLENLSKIDGQAGQNVIDALSPIAPDLARYVIEFPFGDVYEDQTLDLRSREIATIAALTALGNATPQLKVHIQAGLNVGLSKEEIIAIITQMSVYSGFPSAINGVMAAKEVFEMKKEEK